MKIARIICWPQDSTLRPTMKRGLEIIPACAGIDINLKSQISNSKIWRLFNYRAVKPPDSFVESMSNLKNSKIARFICRVNLKSQISNLKSFIDWHSATCEKTPIELPVKFALPANLKPGFG